MTKPHKDIKINSLISMLAVSFEFMIAGLVLLTFSVLYSKLALYETNYTFLFILAMTFLWILGYENLNNWINGGFKFSSMV